MRLRPASRPKCPARTEEQLPSISTEIQRQIEADQKDIKKQVEHAQQQLDLTNVYPGRKGGHSVK